MTDVLTVLRSGATELRAIGHIHQVDGDGVLCTTLHLHAPHRPVCLWSFRPIAPTNLLMENGMSRKLALKRLTASDLTLFKWHFQKNPTSKQKAFNLDTRVLVDHLYPQLGEPSDVPNPRFPLDLYLIGPGLTVPHNLQRKILKQQKNWRLNGELIDNPEGDQERYNTLEAGDFALFEFSGSVIPSTAKVLLISRGNAADAGVHAELNYRFVEGSMWPLSEKCVTEVLSAAAPQTEHPLHDWIESAALEDAVLGGAEGIDQLNRRCTGRGISPEEFVRSRQAAERTGVAGEEFLNENFELQLAEGKIESVEWTSSINAVSPYDFRIKSFNSAERVIDAKSTTGAFGNPIHLSLGELRKAVDGPEPYDIYRLFELTESTAKLRIARDIGPNLKHIIDALSVLPDGVSADSISVRPDLLAFSEDEQILP